jgi:hypothetical protein
MLQAMLQAMLEDLRLILSLGRARELTIADWRLTIAHQFWIWDLGFWIEPGSSAEFCLSNFSRPRRDGAAVLAPKKPQTFQKRESPRYPTSIKDWATSFAIHQGFGPLGLMIGDCRLTMARN